MSLTLVTIALAAGTLLVMALVLTYILGWANVAFHVEVDPRIEAVLDALPGANCGGCGMVGCGEYAEAVVNDGAPVDLCAPGGASCAAAIGNIMGVEVEETAPIRPIVHCGAYLEDRLGRNEYLGEKTCAAATNVAGVQGCVYGCLGFGDCVAACPYDAIHIRDGLSDVDYYKCVGCGACARACPRNIISIEPFKVDKILAVLCSNKDDGKAVRSVCKAGCLGCKLCAKQCDLFSVDNNLSCLIYDDYDPDNVEDILKAKEKCKRNRIEFVGKEEDDQNNND